MQTLPDSTRVSRRLVALAALAVLVVAGGIVAFAVVDDGGSASDGTDRAAVDDAQQRSSPPAPPSDDAGAPGPSPETSPAPPSTEPPTGTDPRIRLGPLLPLTRPSSVVDPAGDGPVLVSTLDGTIHAVDLDTGATDVVLDLRAQVSTGGERGLLGMAIDPGGDRLYVDFTDNTGDTEIRSWALADGRPVGGPDDGVLHLGVGQPYPNHNGGDLVFGPDGMLWIGTGDGGSGGDPGEVAQDPTRLLGKMLRVEPDPAGGVAVPASNPDWGGRPEVWGIGLRNPWRYSFDRRTGRLWIGDVGQDTVEEVSVVDPTAPMPNFGWDDVEGDRPFEGELDPSFVAPVVTYDHGQGCSVTGGYVYRGATIASMYGWYLFGDYCGGWIRAVPADAPDQEPVELVPDAGPVISFAQLGDGELVVLGPDGLRRVVAA